MRLKPHIPIGCQNASSVLILILVFGIGIGLFSYLQLICTSVNTLLQGTRAFHRYIMFPSSKTMCILTLIQILQTHKIPHTLIHRKNSPPDFIIACKAVLLNFGNLSSDDDTRGDLSSRMNQIANEAEVVATRIYGKGMSRREQQDHTMWKEQTTSISWVRCIRKDDYWRKLDLSYCRFLNSTTLLVP